MGSRLRPSLSMLPQRLRKRLVIAVTLMVLIPLSILCMLVALLLPATRDSVLQLLQPIASMENTVPWVLLVLTATLTALSGWGLVSQVIDPLVYIAGNAGSVLTGEALQTLLPTRDDERGDIAKRARPQREELRISSEHNAHVQHAITRRATAMDGVLHIATLIAQPAKLKTILRVALKQLSMIEDGSFAVLYLMREQFGGLELRAAHNMNPDVLTGVQMKPETLTIDDQQRPSTDVRALYERLGGANVMARPIVIRGRSVGLLMIGNHAIGYSFDEEYVELLTMFSRQIAIAVEHDRLARKVSELATKDDITGLYNEHYIRSRLDEEITRAIAYQRPCAFVLFEIDNFLDYCEDQVHQDVERALKRIAWVLLESVTESDRVGCFGTDAYAMVLPERNKRQAADLAEAIRKRIEFAFSAEQSSARRMTLSGGVSENPIDGITAEDLLLKAQESMADARLRGKNCIVA